MKVHAYAAATAGAALEPFTYELPEIADGQVDIKVRYCGICHSDLSMLQNEWGFTRYPFVGGHEVIGEVIATGNHVGHLKVGDKVGLGWMSGSCMHCHQCMSGHQHTCSAAEQTIVGRHGGFADVVRADWSATIKLPEDIDMAKAGPLLCGGITVFAPIMAHGVKPTDKVGIVGIGGLGHMAVKFLKAWGCEVVAFSSSPHKKQALLDMGVHKVINSRDPKEMQAMAGQLDFLINTANVSLDWNALMGTLSPMGHFHNVGAVLEPLAISAFSLITGDKTMGGNGVGSPSVIEDMLEFCVRHDIYPIVENFPMPKINEAMDHLKAGKARFRIVLEA